MSFHALTLRRWGTVCIALSAIGWCANGQGAVTATPGAASETPGAAVDAGRARTPAAADTLATSILPPGFAQESPAAQSHWLEKVATSGQLQEASDVQLLDVMQSLSPAALVDYLRNGIQPLASYQFEMTRWERHDGLWPSRPDKMLVRYQDTPRRTYARWLAGGKHAGQEVLYDETTKPGQVLGHFGGLFRFASIWFPVDGVIAHSQSVHSVRDLGLQFTVKMLEHDLASYREEGLDGRPTQLAIVHEAISSTAAGTAAAAVAATSALPLPDSASGPSIPSPQSNSLRLISMTWDAPAADAGSTAHYAPRVELAIDLRHPWPREIASWDRSGRPLERVIFAQVEPRQWDADTFQRDNPDYHF